LVTSVNLEELEDWGSIEGGGSNFYLRHHIQTSSKAHWTQSRPVQPSSLCGQFRQNLVCRSNI